MGNIQAYNLKALVAIRNLKNDPVFDPSIYLSLTEWAEKSFLN